MDVPGKVADVGLKLCESCRIKGTSTAAKGFCDGCDEYMCNSCFQHHLAARPCRNHVLSQLNQGRTQNKQKEQGPQTCPKHSNYCLRYYCRKHAKVACGDCVVAEHYGCRMEFIYDVAKMFERSPEFKKMGENIKRLETEYAENRRKQNMNRKENASLIDRVLTEIRKFRKELNDYLDDAEREVVNVSRRLSGKNDKLLSELETEINKVKVALDNLNTSLDTSRHKGELLFIRYIQCKPQFSAIEECIAGIQKRNQINIFTFHPTERLKDLVLSKIKLGTIHTETSEIDEACSWRDGNESQDTKNATETAIFAQQKTECISSLPHLVSKDPDQNAQGFRLMLEDVTRKDIRIMRDDASNEQQQNSALLLSHLVQWYYIEITEVAQELTKYDPDLNYKIETAYTSHAPNFKFVTYDTRYVLDFKAMEEYEESNPENKVTVIRRDLVKEGAFEQPKSWDKMQGNLRLITLQQSSQEYQDIAQTFSASVRMQVAVTKIERIQNKKLWSQYMSKKKLLDNQNPFNTKNETMLWHGTAAEAVDTINFYGFNRSYCGRNATAYGDGVYFAVQAAYSASDTYSRPDPLGIKRVYYSRVLTGEYTRGKSGLRIPPPKGCANAAALYDSVVDNPAAPGIYIIFHDTQAYPEYLISFRRG